jgi:glycerol 3-phosphatase-2
MTALLEQYDALLFDLDGTLFRGGTAVPGAPEVLLDARRRDIPVAYLTNNGSRSAPQVAEHLREMGIPADEREVVTSGQAAARILAERLPAGTHVLVVGTEALAAEVAAVGHTPVFAAADADAIVQGHSPDTGWQQLAEACLAIRAGALWVACNIDATLPDERGLLPGNGSMIAALERATGRTPVVAGKPEAGLFQAAIGRSKAERPLVIGDRLDTDIAGAHGVGLPSLLVLTGVATPEDVLTAPRSARPDYVSADLDGLHMDVQAVSAVATAPWRARVDGGELLLEAYGDPTEEPDAVAALRALCEVHWAKGGGRARVRALDPTSARALEALGITPDGARQLGSPFD